MEAHVSVGQDCKICQQKILDGHSVYAYGDGYCHGECLDSRLDKQNQGESTSRGHRIGDVKIGDEGRNDQIYDRPKL